MNALGVVQTRKKLRVAIVRPTAANSWVREIQRRLFGDPKVDVMLINADQAAGMDRLDIDLVVFGVETDQVNVAAQQIHHWNRADRRVIVMGDSHLKPFRLVLAHSGALDTMTTSGDWDKVIQLIQKLAEQQPVIAQDWRDHFFERIPWKRVSDRESPLK